MPTKTIRLNHSGTLSDATINIRVNNFHLQTFVTIDELTAALNRLPPNHLAGLNEIRYDPTRSEQKMRLLMMKQYSNFRAKAEFSQKERQINIYSVNSKSEMIHALYHEIGHYVFYAIIDSTTKKRWVTQVHSSGAFVTPEAKVNASEDFAESYVAFLNSTDSLRRIPIKFSFLKNEIFENTPL